MKEKFLNLQYKLTPQVQRAGYVATAVAASIVSSPLAHADASSLMTTIVKLVATLIVALGLMLAIMGIVNYASSHSEGDGPGQNKAIGKIAAGIMLIALSAILKSSAENLVGEISLDLN